MNLKPTDIGYNYFKDLCRAYGHDSINFRQFINSFLSHVPQISLGSYQYRYNQSIEKYGQEAVLAPHNLYRQLFHILSGVSLSVLMALGLDMIGVAGVEILTIPIGFIISASATYEFRADMACSFKNLKPKNLVDILAHACGAALGSFLMLIILQGGL